MTVLDRFLEKSKAPYTKDDIAALFAQYGDAIRLLTEKRDGQIVAFAVLVPPIRVMGQSVCQLLAAGTDGSVDAKVLFEQVKDEAKQMGADMLMAAVFRSPKAFVRRFDAQIESTNIRWDLGGSRNGENLYEVQVGVSADAGVLLPNGGEVSPRLQAVRQEAGGAVERLEPGARPRLQHRRNKNVR